MATDIVTGNNGEITSGTPIGTGEINPTTGLDFGERKINVEKLNARRLGKEALYFGDRTGEIPTGEVVPKSVYRVLGDDYHPEFDPEYNAQLLSREQSNGGKLLAGLNQAVIGTALGTTIQGFGYMLDLPMIFDLLEGTEQEFGNAFTRIGEKLQTSVEEATPVFTDPKAPKFNPGHWEWWMKNLPSIASTIGLVVPTIAGMSAIKGVANLVGITKELGILNKFSKLFTTSLGQAILSRHMENLMEARGVYNQGLRDAKNALYDKYQDQIDKEINGLPVFTPVDLEKGPQPGQYTKEQYETDLQDIKNKWDYKISQEATKVASIGAANTYNKQWVMLLQDLPEYMLLNRFMNKGVSSIAKGVEENSAQVLKHLGHDMPKWYATMAVKQIANAAGEGGEEFFQFVNEQQSSDMIKNLADPDKKTSFGDQLVKNWDNGDLWTNSFWGAIGAGFMQATMAGINSKAMSDSGKARVKQLTELSPLINKLHADYVAAEDDGDEVGMEAAKKAFVAAVGIKSKQFGNKEHLLNMIDALAEDNQNVLTNYEIDPEARKFFKGKNDIAQELKDDIETISKRYDDAIAEGKVKGLSDKQNSAIASSIAHSNFMLEYLNKKSAEQQAKLQSLEVEGYSKPNPSGEQLSDKGKQAFSVAYQKRDLTRRLAATEKQLAKEDLTKEDKVKYEKQKTRLESKIELANGIIADLAKDDTLTKEQKKLDSKLHGDLTKDEPNGIIPINDVLNFIDTQKMANSYDESVSYFKNQLDDARTIQDNMVKHNKQAASKPTTKPAEPAKPPIEETDDLDVGHIVTYKSTDDEDKRGIVRDIVYAVKDTEGNEVEPSAENVDNVVTIQPVDENNNPIGDLDHVSGATVVKEAQEVQTQPEEGIAEEDITDIEDVLPPEGPDKGDNVKDQNRRKTNDVNKGLIEFLSYTEYEETTPENRGKLKKLIVRNEVLDKFLSNPANQEHLSKGVARYTLDLKNEFFKARLDKARKEKRMPSYLLDALDEYINKGKKLKEEDVTKLLTYADFFGEAAISVELSINGKTFKGGLFVHTLSKTSSHIKDQPTLKIYAQMRKSLVEHLLKGDKVYTVGLSTNRGNPNNIDKTNSPNARKNDVLKTFGFKNYKDVELFILKSSTKSSKAKSYENPTLHRDNESIENIQFDFSSTGSVFVKTNKTLNGQPFAVKLNKSFVSEDHAFIIFNAFSTLAKTELVDDRAANNGKYSGKIKPPQKNGRIGQYFVQVDPHAKDQKESVAWNISAGELLDLLVVHGEELTDPNSARYKYVNALNKMSEEHKTVLENRRLFLQRGYDSNGNVDGIYLCYGKTIPYNINTNTKGSLKEINYNRVNLTSQRATGADANAYMNSIRQFTDWMQNNKTYAVHLEDSVRKYGLGLKLNGTFLQGRNFRIGKKGFLARPTDLPSKKYVYNVNSEIVRNPGESYVEFLLKNGLVTTDIEEKNGSLFSTPFMHLGVNQNVKQDFGFKVGDTPYTKETTSSDLEKVDEIQNEDTKDSLKTEADKKATKGKRKRTKEEISKDGVTESTGEDMSVRQIMDDDNFIKLRERPPNTKVYDVQDLEKELGWIRKTLNIEPTEIKIERDLAKMLLNGKEAWGIFSSAGITIYEAAEKGTIYHEAFHKVNLAYHTKEEREAIYRSARLLYNMPKESFTDNQVEEKIAEEFRDFVISKQTAAQPKGIKKIFENIYNFIRALFYRAGSRLVQSDLDRLFNQIYSGKYRFAKVLTENKKIEPRLRSILGENFDTIQTYKDITTFTKYLAKKLIRSNNVTNLNDVRHITYQNLINDLNKTIDRLEVRISKPDISDAEKNEGIKLIATIKDALGEPDENGFYPKFTAWVKYVDRFLGNSGIVHIESTESKDGIWDQEARYSDLSVEEEGSDNNENWNVPDYFKPSKDTALASVKFVIDTLHESDEVSDTIAMIPFADGNKVWYKLLNDIRQYDDVVDMVNQIRSLGEDNDFYPYIELADILDNASESFRTQFQSSFEMYKHKHLVVQFRPTREGDINMTFDSSGHAELARNTVLKWNEFASNDRNIVQLESSKVKGATVREKIINEEFFNTLAEDYEKDILDWYKDKTDNGNVELSEKDLTNLFKKVSKTLSKIHVDINVDVLRHFAYNINRNRNLQNNLYTFLNDIHELLGPEIIIDNQGNLTNYMRNQTLRALGEAYADVNSHEESDMTVGPEGNMIWKYAKLNLATDNVRRIKRSEKWAADKISRIGNKHSRLLKSFVALNDTPEEIARAKAARDAFGLFTMSNFKRLGRRDKSSRDYLHLNIYEEYLFKAYAILNNAALPFPIMANRRTYFMMEGVDLIGIQDKNGNNLNVIESSNDQGDVVFTDEVINMFYDYYLDEKERVDTAIKVRKDYEEQVALNKGNTTKLRELKDALVRNYHYAGNFNLKLGNAYHYIHFKGFERLKTPEQIKARIQEVLNDRLKGELDFVSNEGIIQRTVDPTTGKLVLNTRLLSDAIIKSNDNIDEPDNFGMLSVLAKIMVNTQMGIMESEKVFLGDPALFKRNDPSDESNYDTYNELYKRWSGVGATGTRLRAKYPGKSTTYNVATLNTQKFESIFHKPMVEKHTELYEKMLLDKLTEEEKKDPNKIKGIKKLAKELATSRLTKYENVDPTDGTALISPEMFKEVTERMGLWDERKEEAFNLLNSDKILSATDIIRSSNIVFNPLKTVYIGNHNFNDIDLLIYNKMAMFTLFRQHVKGTHLEQVLDRMELKGNYAGKGLEKIHVYNFDSAVKTGGLNGMNLFANSRTRDSLNDLGQSFIFQQNFDNLKHQQVVDVHDSMKQNFGTAGFKITTADVSKTEHYGEHGTGEELLNDLHKLRSTLSDFGLHNIDAKFGISNGKVSNKVFIDMLRRDAESANKAFDFINALATDDKGEKYLEIDSFNDRKWIYSRIKSIVDELTVNLNTPGNQLVQMTNYGMNKADYKEDLNFIRSKVGEHTVYAMECKVSIRLFKNFFPRGHQITLSEAQELININPELFGYRVPTQGQNSLMKLVVVGLLPSQTGDIIQLPLEFTALTGSDFDIDKLFVSMHNYEYYTGDDGDIRLRKISFLTGNTEEEQRDRYNNKMLELFDIYKYSLDSFRDVLVDDNGKKVPIVSKYFNSRREELSDVAKEYRENKKEYESEEYNLLMKVQSLEKKIAETKNEIYKKSLDYDLTDAKIKLDDIRVKLTNIPYEIELRKILDLADMASLQEHLILSGKLPTFEDFVKLPIEEQNSNRAVQNQLLDKMLVILSDEKHFINMTTPLGTVNDKLEKKANEYDVIYKPNEKANVPALFTTTPSFQAAMKQKFASSTFGVAPYALMNNHHSLTQMADVVMKSDIDLGFNKKGEIDLSRIIDEDNMYISLWFSALIDAHVDGVNKSYITSLNVNESTHDILGLLIRSGLGEVSFDFINQPIMRAYSDSYFKTNKNFGKNSNRISTIDESDPITHVLKHYNELIEGLGLMSTEELNTVTFMKDNLIPLPELLNLTQLRADAKESMQTTQSKEYYIRQLSILYHLGMKDGIKNDAQLLTNFVLSSRVDTKKYGANPVEIIHFLNGIKNVMDTKRFKNIDKILTWDKNYKYKKGDTFLPTLIKNSMFKIYDILKNESIYATPGFNNMIDDLVDSTAGGTYNRMSMINIVMEELMTYFIGKFFADTKNGMGMKFDNISNLLFERKGSIYNKLTTLNNGTNKLSNEVKDNALINSLIVDFSEDIISDDEGQGIPYTYIKTPYWSRRDDLQRDELVDGFKDLLASPHPELQSLGVALYAYAFYTSGFRQRMYAYTSSIPLSMNREFKYQDRMVHFNEHIKQILATLNSKDGYLEFLTEAKREVFTNMWATQGFAQEMTWDSKTMTGFDNKDGEPLGVKLELSRKELNNLLLGTNADRERVFKPYILIHESETHSVLYEYMGFDRLDNSLYYVSATKKGFGSNGHGTKGLFLNEYGIKTIKGDERSILKYNNPTTERYTTQEKIDIMRDESMTDAERDNFVYVPLEKQLVKEKGVGLADNFYTDDTAAELRELQKEQEDKDKLLEQRQKLNRKAYSIRDYDEETAGKKENEDLKADTNNKTTYDAPIYIDVDGSAKGKNGLGIGAYAEFGEDKYFLRTGDENIRTYLSQQLKKRGYELPSEISNPTAELMGLLTVLNSFKDTSEHIYISQDYATLMYFLKNAVNPNEVNETRLDYIQYKPDPNKPHMVFLIDAIQNRIDQIESNGGSVRIKYVPTKSTKGNKMADQLAKGEHPTIFNTRNDFRSEQWGKPNLNISNTSKEDTKEADETNKNCK